MTSRIVCCNCRNPMTWAAQRVQFGRLMRRGICPTVIKAIQPRCQKCVTLWLRAKGVAR